MHAAPEDAAVAPSSARAELRAIVRLALPIAAAQAGYIALNLVDTAIVGRTSTTALAGTTIGRSLAFAFASLGLGLGSVLEPLASQALGAGEPDRAWKSLQVALRGSLWLAPALALAVLLGGFALPWFGVDRETMAAVWAYLYGHIPGMLAFSAFIACKCFLEAHGKTSSLLIAAISANVVNYIACSLLVRGDAALVAIGLPAVGLPALGPLGAGMASSIATFVLLGVCYAACRTLRAEGPNPAPSVREVYKLGMPIGLQLMAEIGVFSVVSFLAARFGAEAAAAHQVALGLASLSFMGAMGVSGATAVRVGRAIGLGHSPRRAGMVGIAVGGSIMSVTMVSFLLFPEQLLRLFSDDDKVIELGLPLVLIAVCFQFFDGMQAVAGGALRGAGDVRFAFLANVACHWCVGLPVALYLGLACGWQVRGLWVGLSCGLISVALLMVSRFFVISGRAISRV